MEITAFGLSVQTTVP